jgi:hypothetical protein
MKLLRITVLSLIVALPACAGAIAIQQPTDDTPDNGGSYYCPSISQTLKRGTRDTQTSPAGQVSELQNFLADYFNLDEQVAVSGYFGRSTQQYLTRFQAANGLPAYGIAGTLTRAKIADVCKSGGTPSCPVFQQLRCKDGEEYVPGSKDSRGCMTQGYCKPNICPMIAVDCMPGYHTEAVDAVDANGCRKPPVCKPDVCIAYPKPLCKDGYELVEGVRDARGCATQAYCKPKICPMVAWVGVMDNPFFSVTKADGSFEIKDLPAGKYDIEAWHEKLGTQKFTVEVTADEAKVLDITFSHAKKAETAAN